MGVLRWVACLCLSLCACDGSDETTQASSGAVGGRAPCAPPEVPSPDGCMLPGVPADGCAEGEAGILSTGGDIIVDRTTIRSTDVRPIDRKFGRGAAAQGVLWPGDPFVERGWIEIRTSLVEESFDVGVFLSDGDGVIETSVVRDVHARPETKIYGDAISVAGENGTSTPRVQSTLLQRAERAGVSVFARPIELSHVSLDCNPIHLNGEGAFELTDSGGTVCGCEGAFTACQILSSGLEAPSPIEQ